MKNTTYKIILRPTNEHITTMRMAGMNFTKNILHFDGEKFQEGSFDVEKWTDKEHAYAKFKYFAQNNDFASGLEMVLVREIYDENSDDYQHQEILTKYFE